VKRFVTEELVFMTRAGSHMYGTNIATSDIDKRGVCVPPRIVLMGFARNFRIQEFPGEDTVVYALQKFLELATDCNPNIIELLFAPEDCIEVIHPTWEKVLEKRDLFLTAKAYHTFTGYAHHQMKRIKGHRAWLLNPPTHQPTREEFGLTQAGQGVRDLARGVDVSKISPEALKIIEKEKKYKAALTVWNQYEKWKKERNPARAKLEAAYGYDCYADDTLFLTDGGWKRFDDVDPQDKLATVYVGPDLTVRKFGRIEYQTPVEQFEGTFTGNLYQFSGHHVDVLVTPNHRMLYREVSRRKGETYGIVLEEASRLPESFDFLRTTTPRSKRYSTKSIFSDLPIKPEAFLRLMGWYLSDGSAGTKKLKDGTKVTVITVSQKKGGRLHQELSKFNNKYSESIGCSLYAYDRTNVSGGPVTELVLHVRDKIIRERITRDCGRTKSKRIPRYVFGLSKRMMETLFDSMCGGDGTIRKTSKKSWVYYTSLPGLADDVNELALHCGWETSVWGPYDNDTEISTTDSVMYHVHVDKNAEQFQRISRRYDVTTVPAESRRIVCFTVPNGTLITRRNGRVGIHGNSKHAMHLVRLLRMGKEILTTGKIHVRRPDAEDLLAIRRGEWSYDKLVEEAEALKAELDEVYENKSYVVPFGAPKVEISDFCVELHDYHWTHYAKITKDE
jgi:predicted nucleotidyltransferase